MTVLYDAGCRLCRSARRWLESRRQAVPLEFVPAGSPAARSRFPEPRPGRHAARPDRCHRRWPRLRRRRCVAGLPVGTRRLPRLGRAFRSTRLCCRSRARAIAMAAAARERDRARYGVPDAEEARAATTAATTTVAEPATARGEQTKRLIVDVAMRLFREDGYEQDDDARDCPGGGRLGRQRVLLLCVQRAPHRGVLRGYAGRCTGGLARPVLAASKDFGERLRGTMRAGIEALSPYHEFAGNFFKYAAEPTSPLHPLSTESTPGARRVDRAVHARCSTDRRSRSTRSCADELPELLWMALPWRDPVLGA